MYVVASVVLVGLCPGAGASALALAHPYLGLTVSSLGAMGRLEIALDSIVAGIGDIQLRLNALENLAISGESLQKSLHSDLEARLHFVLDKFEVSMESNQLSQTSVKSAEVPVSHQDAAHIDNQLTLDSVAPSVRCTSTTQEFPFADVDGAFELVDDEVESPEKPSSQPVEDTLCTSAPPTPFGTLCARGLLGALDASEEGSVDPGQESPTGQLAEALLLASAAGSSSSPSESSCSEEADGAHGGACDGAPQEPTMELHFPARCLQDFPEASERLEALLERLSAQRIEASLVDGARQDATAHFSSRYGDFDGHLNSLEVFLVELESRHASVTPEVQALLARRADRRAARTSPHDLA